MIAIGYHKIDTSVANDWYIAIVSRVYRFVCLYSEVAQPVEQVAVNHWAVGSSPTLGELFFYSFVFPAMPIIASAKKALKRSRFLHERNETFKIAMKKAIKFAKKTITETPDATDIQGLVKTACIAIDKAAKTKVIHPNNAARKKSRLMAMAQKTQ